MTRLTNTLLEELQKAVDDKEITRVDQLLAWVKVNDPASVDELETGDPSYHQDDADWFREAESAIEDVLESEIDEFAEHPLMHRVEHCLHTRIAQRLRQCSILSRPHKLGGDGPQTQLVSKEWPETIPRPEKRDRRGNFDIAVLSPQAIVDITALNRIDHYLEGRICPSFVIEIGLDYDHTHLENDLHKISNSICRSNLKRGYLLHFLRGNTRPDELNRIRFINEQLQSIPIEHGIVKLACVVAGPSSARLMKFKDNDFHEVRFAGV